MCLEGESRRMRFCRGWHAMCSHAALSFLLCLGYSKSMFRHEIQSAITQALLSVFPEWPRVGFTVEAPSDPVHGDYASNIALLLARPLKKNPLAVAEEIKKALLSKTYTVEVAPPGFLNFRIRESALRKSMREVLKKPAAWGTSKEGAGKTVIVEYFQLNIAKRPHVGHIRSAIIGDALKRMLLSQGYRAVSDTHVGDWGTQFGILLLGYKEAGASLHRKKIVADPFGELEEIYLTENKRIENDPPRRERAKQEFAKLEQGNKENREIWEWLVGVSMKNLEENAGRLKLLSFDEHRGESFYEDRLTPIVELALQKGVAKKTADGAVVVDLKDDGLDEAILIKSDGASTYLLRDLATIQYRKEHWDFWKNIYVVDVRQSHHFKQVFRVAELLGFELGDQSSHIEFGFMSLPEGAISTRKGNVIYLDKVLDEATARARAIIAEKNPELKNADGIAQMVGLGALKYFDLSHHRRSDVVFDWDTALAFEGNTGPYIQYAHARLKSILRKLNEDTHDFPDTASFDETERRLAVTLIRFLEAIQGALSDFTPNTLAEYLHHAAEGVNAFYHSHPVMQEEDTGKKEFRVALVTLAALTLRRGLDLLGIEAPEEM